MKTEEVIHHLTSQAERAERLASNADRRHKGYAADAEAFREAAAALGGKGNGNAHGRVTKLAYVKKGAA